SFISEFFRQYRETGKIEPKPKGGDRRSLIKGKEEELLKKIVIEQNDIYLREIQAAIEEQTEIEVSISSLSRTLKRLDLRRKKTLVASDQKTQRVQKMRYEFRRWLDTIDVKNLVFINETGLNLAMTRNYGKGIIEAGKGIFTIIFLMSNEGLNEL
ncbi:MAG: winged helix-turn-helix domain-containing protein, partial [Anabaena sp. CoA2_C59]|nr:winged helix-turn-helix domain-containing protein [Anabaena sp. CoA2_C59]